jgi:hypothetical protein
VRVLRVGPGHARHPDADNLPTQQILLSALVFGYAGAVLSRIVRTPGPGGRRFRLRAGLLLGLPALFGLVFGLTGVAV